MKIVLLNAFLFLVACASSSAQETSRSGIRYTIVCKHSSNQCYYKAQDRCGGLAYAVLSTSEMERSGGPYGRYREYTMHIQCK